VLVAGLRVCPLQQGHLGQRRRGGVVKVPFADLKVAFGAADPFDASALVSIVFLTLDEDKTHNFTIDDIAFY
jgi:hypothetical protein